MTVWFTSDTHYYHSRVIEYCDRPYLSVEEMNEDLIKKWNEVVKPDDIVYHLGDFSMAFRAVEIFSRRLMGQKKLVPGNHDFCHSFHKRGRKDAPKWRGMYRDLGWEVLPEQCLIEIGGQIVNLCHLPYRGDVPHNDKGRRDKYWNHRLEPDGKWLICGHVHQSWKTKGKCLNVGVDVWNMAPVNIDQVLEIINERT